MSQQLREFRQRIEAAKSSFIEPCLPSTMAKPPAGAGWIHEIKHDGYRLMVKRVGQSVRLITRNGHDWTDRYPGIVATAAKLRCRSCLIDGEAVIVDGSGLAMFNLLRHGTRVKPQAFLYAFDLLELDGKDLKREPLEDRKAALAKLLRNAADGIRHVDHFEGEDAALIFEHACALGCEGIVSKRKDSRYRSGRSRDWIKTKNPAAPAVRREDEEDWNDRSRKVSRTRPRRADDPLGARRNLRREHPASKRAR